MSPTDAEAGRIEIPGCVRRLSNAERIFISGANSGISLVARIIGDVSHDELMRALESVRKMHPLIGSKIVFDGNGDAWFSTDRVPGTILTTVPRTSETRWIDEINREFTRQFDFETGPLIRFALIYSPEVSEFIIYSHHCMSDGAAIVNLVRNIFTFYADPKMEIEVIQPLTVDDCIHREGVQSSSDDGASAAVRSYNSQWESKPSPLSLKDFYEVYNSFWEKNHHGLAILQLSPGETSDLVSRCREKGITMVSAISAAFLLALQEVMGPIQEEDSLIGVSFDLRKRLGVDVGDVFCCFVGGASISVSNSKKPFWEMAKDIHRDFKRMMEAKSESLIELECLDQTLIDAVFGVIPYIRSDPDIAERTQNLSAFARDSENIAFVLNRKWSSRYPCAVITNMGRSTIPETYGNIKLDCLYPIASASPLVPFMIGGSGVGGRLTVCINYRETAGEEGLLLRREVIAMRNRMLQHFGFPERASSRSI